MEPAGWKTYSPLINQGLCSRVCHQASRSTFTRPSQPGVGNAPATPDDEDDESDILSPDNEFSVYTRSTITYAMNLARTAETYSVHPWRTARPARCSKAWA
eukprot:1158429-Pelagomonas_calceolata.AAC.4